MKKLSIFLWAISLVSCMTSVARAEIIGGVDFPDGVVSFADSVFQYSQGSSVVSPYNNPDKALGIPDGTGSNAVALGNGGMLTLRFTDNSLTASGNADLDLWIFEVGPQVENMRVSISVDGVLFFNVGDVSGQPTGIDIDAYIAPGGIELGEKYSYIRIVDLAPNTSSYPYAGADIDAVGAISSAPPVPLPGGVWLLGSGLFGLLRFRKRFCKC